MSEGNEVESWVGHPTTEDKNRMSEEREIDMTVEKTLGSTMEERGNNYGEFTDIAQLSQQITSLIGEADRRSAKVSQMNPVQREAMKMILHKIARIAVGDADYADNWHDIQGYAKLVEDRL